MLMAVPMLLGIDWMDPEWLLDRFGDQMFWVSVAIVFIECGLLFPILPGDSLLFSVGLFVHRAQAGEAGIDVGIVTACVILSLAAFLGNVVGYEIGRAIGEPLQEHTGRFIKKKYFDQTHEFFEKYGARALVLGRFVPIVRTFITVVAGIGKMDRRHFFVWSFVGAVLWATGLTLLGYFLGGIEFLQHNIEAAVLVIVLVSVLPMVVEYWRHRKAATADTDAS
jgi:membrane-associated protein